MAPRDESPEIQGPALRTDQDWEAWLRRAAAAPGWDAASLLAGTAPAGRPPATAAVTPTALWDGLDWLARRHGFTVRRSTDTSAGLTTWNDRQITVRLDSEPGEACQLVLHELAHVLLHSPLAHAGDANTAGCRGLRKVEADSVAFVVATWLGLDTSGYSWPYVASWAGSDPRAEPETAIRTAATHITRSAATIIDHLDVVLFGRQPRSAQTTPARSAARSSSTGAGTGPGSTDSTHEASRDVTDRAFRAARLHPVLREAEQFYLAHRDIAWAPRYLADRGIDAGTIRRWRIGFAPDDWTALTSHLRSLGYDDELIEAAGLARRSSRGTLIDHFRNRVMLTIRTGDGAVAGFIGRAHPTAGSAVPKYLNSPETAAYVKGDLLFGLHESRRQLTKGVIPVIVEGPFDAIAVTAAAPGEYAGLAPCGTALTSRQVTVLAQATALSSRHVLVALDGDRAGRDGALRAYGPLTAASINAAAVLFSPGRDPAEVLQKQGARALAQILRGDPQSLARLVIDTHLDQLAPTLRHAEGQLTALRSAAAFIASTLPPQAADAILAATGHRQLRTLDENLRPVSNPELAEIARLLPYGPACQIIRTAERLEADCSDVLAIVANCLTSSYPPAQRPRQPTQTTAPGAAAAGFAPARQTSAARASRAPPRRRATAAVTPAAGRRSPR